MKKFLLTLLAAIAVEFAVAQNYAIISSVGTTSEYNWNQSGSSLLLPATSGGSANDVYSANQTLPFAWSFYGNPVTQYKVSDNGFITFDVNETSNPSANVGLPTTTGPKNAIFAFWDNLELKPLSTYPYGAVSFNYGTAPNRVHVVQWRLSQIEGSATTQAIYFAIRIYEAGDFDVVINYGFAAFSSTIGVNNATGTVGAQVAGSPSYTLNQGNYDASLSNVYKFAYLTQARDITILSHTIPAVQIKTTPVAIAGKLLNLGTAAVTSLTLNYQVDGGAVKSDAKTGLSIASGATYNFNHATAYSGGTPGIVHTIKIWADNINGSTDMKNSNDTIVAKVFLNNGTPAVKYVLLEEATGGWCGYCPDGHLKMRDLLAANTKLIGVTHHNSDGMTNTESDLVNSTFAAGYPSGYINRVPVGGAVGLNRGIWSSTVTSELSTASPVNVTITNKSYNATTKQITFTVNANFVDYAAGDLRIGAMVIEDNVRGNDVHNTWTQHNYYSPTGGNAGGASHELYNEPEWIVGYLHRHVVRAIPSGAFGNAGIIPAVVAPAGSYSKTYTWTVPNATKVTYAVTPQTTNALWSTVNGWGMNKLNDIALLGFVAYYDADINKRQILNSSEVSLWSTGMDTKVIDMNTISADVYPNPSNGETKVQFTLTQTSDVTVKIVNALGQEVKSFNENGLEEGNHEVNFNVSELPTGVYFAIVSGNNFSQASAKFVVTK